VVGETAVTVIGTSTAITVAAEVSMNPTPSTEITGFWAPPSTIKLDAGFGKTQVIAVTSAALTVPQSLPPYITCKLSLVIVMTGEAGKTRVSPVEVTVKLVKGWVLDCEAT
jgi:hypothetical protein